MKSFGESHHQRFCYLPSGSRAAPSRELRASHAGRHQYGRRRDTFNQRQVNLSRVFAVPGTREGNASDRCACNRLRWIPMSR